MTRNKHRELLDETFRRMKGGLWCSHASKLRDDEYTDTSEGLGFVQRNLISVLLRLFQENS